MTETMGLFDKFIKDTDKLNSLNAICQNDIRRLETRLSKLKVLDDREVKLLMISIKNDLNTIMKHTYLITKENCERDALVNVTDQGLGKLSIRRNKKKLMMR